ncbi:MAG: hypothetical protein AABY22_09860 [Nanoarchaeota archaeon]
MNNNPKIILIGGTSYIGKSTISLQLGFTLNIKQIVDIDTIRDVLRGELSKKQSPYLHYCSTTAWQYTTKEMTKKDLTQGYEKYCKIMLPHVRRIIKVAKLMGKDTIIEGVHIIPKLYKNYTKRRNVYLIILKASEENHWENLKRRREEFRGKRMEKYKKRFPYARIIQDYLISEAKKYKIDLINNEEINTTAKEIMKIINKRGEK